jgi:alpha-mannosidase
VEPVDYTEEWVEFPTGTFPQKAFVDVSDGNHGLMVANRGLTECEAFRSESGITVALTLLRCTGWLSRNDLRSRRGEAGPVVPAAGGQALGEHVFDYSLIPHSSGWQNAAPLARSFGIMMRSQRTANHKGKLPLRGRFVRVDPDCLVVSSVKLAETGNAVIMRLYNPAEEHVEANIEFYRQFKAVGLANLREETLDVLARDARNIRLTLRPAQIITLKLDY